MPDIEKFEAVNQANANTNDMSVENKELQDKVNNLYNAILPLLSNLKANPEKEYILWPNRTAKIEAFEELIGKIIK